MSGLVNGVSHGTEAQMCHERDMLEDRHISSNAIDH